MATTLSGSALVATTDDGPIVLIGAPPRLSGTVRLANRGEDKLKFKPVPVRFAAADAPSRGHLQMTARLAPGTAAHVPLDLEIDESTPPGTYRAEVDLGGQSRTLSLRVLARRSVTVVPTAFDLAGAPGTTVRQPVIIANNGNVPFLVPRVALVALGESGALTSLFHVAMAKAGAQGHAAALDAYASMLAASEVDAARAVFTEAGGRTIAPGATLATEIDFELPARLARHRTYSGVFAIGRVECTVDIVVNAATEAPPAAPTPRTSTSARKRGEK